MNPKMKYIATLLLIALSFAPILAAEENSREDLEKGWADFSGAMAVPRKVEQNPPNLRLVGLAKKEVKLDIVNNIDLKDITLVELATLINSKIPTTSKWRVVVSDNAKQLQTSGTLSKDLISSLSPMLRHQDNFYCRITDGVIEFKKGESASNIIPLEESSLFKNKDSVNAEVTTVTQTIEKFNAKFNMKIADVMALDLIKIFEVRVVKVDISEVKEVIKKRDIKVTMKAERWIDIITNIADQIGADILISPGKIKLVPHREITQKN